MTTTASSTPRRRAGLARPHRVSVTDQATDTLRRLIIGGRLAPGVQLSEEEVRGALGVSRSTLREAFQILVRERLIVHDLGRGVFVRHLTVADVVDLYRVRRVVEVGALREAQAHAAAGTPPPAAAVRRLHEATDAGEAALASGDWTDVALASAAFHRAVADLADSPRLGELVGQVLDEFRLAYPLMPEAVRRDDPYIAWHRRIADLVDAGRLADAAALLAEYLDDAESRWREGGIAEG